MCLCVFERQGGNQGGRWRGRERGRERLRFILRGNGIHNYRGWDDPRCLLGKLEAQEGQCVVLIQVWRPDNQESQWHQFQSKSLQSEELKKKSRCFLPNLKPRKDFVPAQIIRPEEFPLSHLLYSGLQLIGWHPSTLGTAICFTESTDSNVNLTH